MSINFEYRRLSQSELDELLSGSEEIFEKWFGPLELDDAGEFANYIERLQTSDFYLDISNSWQAIHFLLTGEFCFQGESRVPAPIKNVVMGGTPTDIETTYGVVFYLTPQEVAEVAGALEPLPFEVVGQKYDAGKFRDAGVYPSRGNWTEDGLRVYGIDTDYTNLRHFFLHAAHDEQAMLIASE